MIPRLLAGLAISASLLATHTATAEPDIDLDKVDQPSVTDAEDLPVRQKSYFVPFAEIMLGNFTLSVSAQLSGVDWGQSSLATMERNLTTEPKFDDDAYSTNQLGHPFGGALLFSAARSTGHDFWVSGLYTTGGSLVWELLLENEIPSINDQITTSIGGMFIGEAVHRFGRALLYRGYGKPGFARKTAAAVLDPVGAVNRAWWGDAWAKTVPPHLNAHFGIGYNQPTTIVGDRGGGGQFHVEAVVEHGLTGDRAFQPRRPLDHFQLETSLDVSPDDLYGSLYVRGMLLGGGTFREDFRGMAGLFGAYDYNNDDYVRASQLGVGPGGTAEIPIGNQGYISGTLAAYLVPYGAAGGVNEVEGAMKDHHDGPGMAQLAEIKVGQKGLYSLRLTSRAYEIAGRVVGEEANEFVFSNSARAMVNINRHHAIGVEGNYAIRRTSFTDEIPIEDRMGTDRAAEIRAFYAITTDEILGH